MGEDPVGGPVGERFHALFPVGEAAYDLLVLLLREVRRLKDNDDRHGDLLPSRGRGCVIPAARSTSALREGAFQSASRAVNASRAWSLRRASGDDERTQPPTTGTVNLGQAGSQAS